jgi:hypothetical protein
MNFNNSFQRKKMKSLLAAALILLVPFSFCFGQDSTAKKKPLLSIYYTNINNDSFFVKVSAGYKDEKFIPTEYKNIRLYLNDTDKNNFLGEVTTNPKGEGYIYFPKKFKGMIEGQSSFDLVAETDADSILKAGSGSATIENTFLDVQTELVDTTKIIRVIAYAITDKGKTPLPEVEVNFIVKRMVGLFPLSAEAVVTDSLGMAKIEYTVTDMPGDSSGTIFVGAKLADADTYGNTIFIKPTTWGTKTMLKYEDVRALWATADRVPIWLLVLAFGIIITVWGTIFFIVMQVIKINKIGKKLKLENK